MINSLSNNCMMIPHRPFVNNDICFISKLEDAPSFSFHISSPFLHYEDEAVLIQDLQNHFRQQQPLTSENMAADALMADSSTKDVANDGSKQEGCSKESNSSSAAAVAAAEQIPRKKTCKKDRHSKIHTAHGPRDRRMRLSLDVARKFFDLQDLLGFDKASKTVEWLLTKSRSAIKELSRGLPQMRSNGTVVGANSGASSTSECEVISGIDDESAINESQQMLSKVKPSCTKEKKKKIKAARRIPYHPLAKQAREKARERARERTKEKIRRLGESTLHIAEIDHQSNRLGSWNSSLDQTGERSGTKDYIKNPSPHNDLLVKEVEGLSRHERHLAGTPENLVHDSMVVGGNWSPSALFNYHPSAGVSTNAPQFMDLQFYCKSSEAYSNMNICG